MTDPTASPVEPDLAAAEDRVLRLLEIPGPSCRERAVADFLVQELRAAGARPDQLDFDKAHEQTPESGEVGNLILELPGTVPGPRRLLSAHMDTVPICVGAKPERHERLVRSADPNTGLGADNRAGCAVILTAAIEILRHGLPHPPLTFCWFVQEEIGLQGARCVDRQMLGGPQVAFNWDGGSPTKLTIGATGGYRMQIHLTGVASHAGVAPECGVSAITIASVAIADLHHRGWLGRIQKGKSSGTANIGAIQGGQATNVVADKVTLSAEARSHDPEFRGEVISQIEAAFQAAAGRITNVAGASGHARIEGRLDYESFRLEVEEPCVAEASRAIQTLRLEPEYAIADGGLDANWLNRHGIPTVSLGCGQRNQHMTSEMLDLDDFAVACRLGLRLAMG